MVKNSDLFINTYSVDEIFNILKLKNPTKEMFEKKVFDLLSKTEDNETKRFLEHAQKKVLEDHFNISTNSQYIEGEGANNLIIKDKEEKDMTRYNRLIHINSKFRDSIRHINKFNNATNDIFRDPTHELSTTKFTLKLDDTLINVSSLELENMLIPITWYAYDFCLGNNYFWFIDNNNNSIYLYYIEPAIFSTTADLITVLNAANRICISGSCGSSTAANRFTFADTSHNLVSCTVDPSCSVVFFSPDAKYQNGGFDISGLSFGRSYANHNLGWSIGYRNIDLSAELKITGSIAAVAAVAPNLKGTKTIHMVLDDFAKNYMDRSVTNTQLFPTKIMLPDYYYKSRETHLWDSSFAYLRRKIPKTIGEFNQNLTEKQVYTANQIIDSRKDQSVIDYLLPTPILRNVLSVVNINNWEERGGHINIPKRDLVELIRKYKSVVNIDRFEVKLYDEYGILLNLNGSDWSFTLKATQLE